MTESQQKYNVVLCFTIQSTRRPQFVRNVPTSFLIFSCLFLNILSDKPICKPDQKRVYGVARNEAADILCEVDAYPPPENFKWSFNNTAETFDMPQSGYRLHSDKASALTYTPVKVNRSIPFALWRRRTVADFSKLAGHNSKTKKSNFFIFFDCFRLVSVYLDKLHHCFFENLKFFVLFEYFKFTIRKNSSNLVFLRHTLASVIYEL